MKMNPDYRFVLDGVHELDFSRVKCFVIFIGSARSGHTLVSQIINSHKDALISNEVDILNSKKTKEELLELMYRNTLYKKEGLNYKVYKDYYQIGYYQGLTTKPLVIGNKFGGRDTDSLIKENIFKHFNDIFKLPVKFIWVQRNPYDHIASKLEMGISFYKKYDVSLCIHFYIRQYKISQYLSSVQTTLKIYLDNLLEFPDGEIKKIMDFLKLSIDDDHINACKNIMESKARKHKNVLNEKQIKSIEPYYNNYMYEMFSDRRSRVHRF